MAEKPVILEFYLSFVSKNPPLCVQWVFMRTGLSVEHVRKLTHGRYAWLLSFQNCGSQVHKVSCPNFNFLNR